MITTPRHIGFILQLDMARFLELAKIYPRGHSIKVSGIEAKIRPSPRPYQTPQKSLTFALPGDGAPYLHIRGKLADCSGLGNGIAIPILVGGGHAAPPSTFIDQTFDTVAGQAINRQTGHCGFTSASTMHGGPRTMPS